MKRFHEKYVPVTESGCWIWVGANDGRCGYGKIKIQGKMVGAHRVSYELHIDDIPDGMYVLHKCDVPSCVNPDHLFLGTHSENMKDMYLKGRVDRSGEKHYATSLTEENVKEIRRRYAAGGISQQALATEFGTTRSAVAMMVLRKSWKNVD
jgi:hypothetical protein